MFKLTDDAINYIISQYGGTKEEIQEIEKKLNFIDVIDDEEDFFDLVSAIISQKETIKFKLQFCKSEDEKNDVIMTDDEIIEMELNRKYENFENSSTIKKAKIKKFSDNKKRHF